MEVRDNDEGENVNEEIDILDASSSGVPERRTLIRSKTPETTVKCFFCDSGIGELHRVLTFKLERKVKQSAIILDDNLLLGKLGLGDMIARDAMYHTNCLLQLYRRLRTKSNDDGYDDMQKQINGQVLAEVASYMEKTASEDKVHVFKLTDIEKMYKERVRELEPEMPIW